MADNVIDEQAATLDAELMDLAARLFDAARSGDAAMLAAYVDAGVPVDLTNANGDTMVMLAAYYGNESAVAALIARGADVDRHNNEVKLPWRAPSSRTTRRSSTCCCQPMPIRWQARRPHSRPRGTSNGTKWQGNWWASWNGAACPSDPVNRRCS
jgi:hypothetical protein